MLTKPQVRAILDKSEVFQDGHFVTPEGHHTAQAAYGMRVLQHPAYASSLAATLAMSFRSAKPQAVVASAGENALLGLEMARALHARLVLLRPEGNGWALAPGQSLEPGERVVLAEVTWVESAEQTARAAFLASLDNHLLGVAALLDRSQEDATRWQVEALLRPEAALWAPASCPLCDRGEPLSTARVELA